MWLYTPSLHSCFIKDEFPGSEALQQGYCLELHVAATATSPSPEIIMLFNGTFFGDTQSIIK